jgi:HSP20 family protein
LTLATYQPFELQLDRLLDEAVRGMGGEVAGRIPLCNVWEDADHFYLEAALPGWQAKDVDLKVEDGLLTLKGEYRDSGPEGRNYLMRELGWTNFTRSFDLPTNVDSAKATASFKDGILTVVLPKREDAKPRQITIQ